MNSIHPCFLAAVSFRPVSSSDLRNQGLPIWDGYRVTIDCVIHDGADDATGNDIDVSGLGFESFVRGAQMRNKNVREDDVLHVSLFQIVGDPIRDIEVKGEEGWTALIVYVKDALRHSQRELKLSALLT